MAVYILLNIKGIPQLQILETIDIERLRASLRFTPRLQVIVVALPSFLRLFREAGLSCHRVFTHEKGQRAAEDFFLRELCATWNSTTWLKSERMRTCEQKRYRPCPRERGWCVMLRTLLDNVAS